MQKRFSCWVLTAALLMGLTGYAMVASESPADEAPMKNIGLSNTSLVSADPTGVAEGAKLQAEDRLAAESDRLRLYLDEASLNIKVEDKSNGYIWSSAIPRDRMQSLNLEWQRIAASLLVAEYISASGAISRSPLLHSNARAPRIEYTDMGFRANVEFHEAQIEAAVYVELTDAGLMVRVPDEHIVHNGSNILHKLHIMPFFGASQSDGIPGYVFVPDGSGALIRFQKPRAYMSSFSSRVYGQDHAVRRPAAITSAVHETGRMMVHLPLFGIAHGGRQNAFLAVAVSGDAFMEIEASPAGATTEFTWACAKFIYRSQYLQPTSKAGGGFTALQPETNTVNAGMEYIFLSGEDADYVGMAKAYRERLRQEGVLTAKGANGPIKLRLEALMAEPAKGLLSNRTQVMTRISDVSRWVDELSGSGVSAMSVVLWGFERGGVNGHTLNSFAVDKGVGKAKEIELLYHKLKQAQSDLVLRKEIFSGYEGQMHRSGLAFHMDGGLIDWLDVTKPLFQRTFYNGVDAMRSYVDSYERNPYFMRNIALSGLSTQLFSDYRRNRTIHRNDMIDEIQTILETAGRHTGWMPLYTPNAYALKYADAVYDVPMHTSRFIYQTDTVPFIQIVLSGSIAYFAPAMNFGTNTVEEILRHIDFGAYPSYVLTQEYSSKLASTNLNNIYSSRYDDLKPYIINSYLAINDILKSVQGKSIEKRIIPEDGIVIVGYEGGTEIVINYTGQGFIHRGQRVEPLSAQIVKE